MTVDALLITMLFLTRPDAMDNSDPQLIRSMTEPFILRCQQCQLRPQNNQAMER